MKTPLPPTSNTATTGFSLSPGGLLLPYHVAALEALEYHKCLDANTPLAGSSAGGIAVAAHACGISGPQVLDATIEIADHCQTEYGGTRGRLLGALRSKLETLITDQEHAMLQDRPGPVAIAYREVFPRYQSRHETHFETRNDLINAICHSSSFPFFTTHWPVALDRSTRIPRLVVDGYFAVPRDRFGCPDFEVAEIPVDRTVMISVFPQDKIKLAACEVQDCISPSSVGAQNQMANLLRLATQSSSREELTAVYEAGWQDAERWCREHSQEKEEEGLMYNDIGLADTSLN